MGAGGLDLGENTVSSLKATFLSFGLNWLVRRVKRSLDDTGVPVGWIPVAGAPPVGVKVMLVT